MISVLSIVDGLGLSGLVFVFPQSNDVRFVEADEFYYIISEGVEHLSLRSVLP